MKTYHFTKTGRYWYIDLPGYLEQGGDIGDLQMVEGADSMLDMMTSGKNEVSITVSKEPFQGADILILTEKCDPYIGGGYYLMKEYEGQQIDKTMWLCNVTEFVFGDLPPQIFIKKQSDT